MSKEEMEKAMNKAKEIVSSYPVVIFSFVRVDWTAYCSKRLYQKKSYRGYDRVETNQKGKLVPLLTEAGALAKISSKL